MDITPQFFDHYLPASPIQQDKNDLTTITSVPIETTAREIILVLSESVKELDSLTPEILRSVSAPLLSWCTDGAILANLVKGTQGICLNLRITKKALFTKNLRNARIRNLKALLRMAKSTLSQLSLLIQIKPHQELGASRGGRSFLDMNDLVKNREIMFETLNTLYHEINEGLRRFELQALGSDLKEFQKFPVLPGHHNMPLVMLKYRHLRIKDFVECDEVWYDQIARRGASSPAEGNGSNLLRQAASMAFSDYVLPSTKIEKKDGKKEKTMSDLGLTTTSESRQTTIVESQRMEQAVERQREIETENITVLLERISNLMNHFAAKVYEQREVADNILSCAETAIENVTRAEKEIQKSLARKWGTRRLLFILYTFGGCILLLCDIALTVRLL